MAHKILGQSAFWVVNKELSKTIGIEPALMLSDLLDKEQYFRYRDEMVDNDYFYNTSDHIQESTTLNYHAQKKCIKVLEEHELISTKLTGVPAKLHFRVHETQILNFLKTSIEKPSKQVLENFETNNNIYNNKYIHISESEFLEIWKRARLHYDKKPTNISRLNTTERSNFNLLAKEYSKKQFEHAVAGLFFQKTVPAVRVRPSHFLQLERFETYLDCWLNKIKLYEDDKKKDKNTGML